MKFFTCASYYGTGSSAITDLLSEYEGIFDFTNEEFRFLHDPDGISDLEYNLVENFNRHNSGHALKRYKKLVDFCNGRFLGPKYNKLLGKNWKDISYKYIDNLTEFKYHAYWLYDFYDRGTFYHFRKRIINKILKSTIWRNRPDRQYNSMKNEFTLCSHPNEEDFLKYTRAYINDLFSSVCPKDCIAMVDQLVPSTNIKRYLRYFDDIHVIVVDRDPRDIWVLEKYVWKDGVIPHEDVETFCKWFMYTRNHRNHEDLSTSRIKFIQFEDLVYQYDNTVKEIEGWLGLNSRLHKYPKQRFDPSKSILNTQTWFRLRNIPMNEIEYIEKTLSNYLYRGFPAVETKLVGLPDGITV